MKIPLLILAFPGLHNKLHNKELSNQKLSLVLQNWLAKLS